MSISIWCWDSNPQTLGRESPPITTRPGLPPISLFFILCSLVSTTLDFVCKNQTTMPLEREFMLHLILSLSFLLCMPEIVGMA